MSDEMDIITNWQLAALLQLYHSGASTMKDIIISAMKYDPEDVEKEIRSGIITDLENSISDFTDQDLPDLSYIKPDFGFYAQRPESVARGLIGAEIVRVMDDTVINGIITSVDAWPEPVKESQNEGYYQLPGNIYLYKGGYGKTYFAITAHESSGKGVVRIEKMIIPEENREVPTSKIMDEFLLNGMDKKYINQIGLVILRNPLDPSYKVKEILPKPNEKFSVRYTMVKR